MKNKKNIVNKNNRIMLNKKINKSSIQFLS